MTNVPLAMEFKYRADIDGLRAIAVLAVLFFHTDVPGFSGGFIGVDVFFVISGYLITSIILKDIKAGEFSIARFYERRVRRIFPALFSVIAFTLAVGAYLFDATAFKDLGHSIAATTLFSSNILFWRESGYFAAPSLQKPLLHTWSLAVEEQFYIFFPLALLAIFRWMKGRYLPWIIIAFILSFAASVYGVLHEPGATFYLVPTRSWELIAGSLLALGVIPDPTSNWQRNLLGFGGIILIILSIMYYSEATPFPGASALMPVMGSAFVIWSGMGGGTHAAQKLFKMRPLVFVGLISYSLYLWHWPLVAFARYMMFRPFNGYESAGIILASLTISTLTWKYIEQPFRGKQMLLPDRKRLFGVAGVVMAVASGIGGVIHLRSGMPERYPEEIMAVLDRAKNDPVFALHDEEWEKLTEKIGEGVTPPVVGVKDEPQSFALVGDSHAISLIPALESVAKQTRISGFIMTSGDRPPLLSLEQTTDLSDKRLSRHNDAIVKFIGTHPEVDAIIITARWARYTMGHQYKAEEKFNILFKESSQINKKYAFSNSELVNKGLEKMVCSLLQMNRKVILVSDVPEIGYDVPTAYFKSAVTGYFDLNLIRPTVQEYNERQKEANAILEKLAKLPGVSLIRPEQRMFDETGRGRIMANGELLYNDDDHLSTAGALYVAPVFDQAFKEIAMNHAAGSKISEN